MSLIFELLPTSTAADVWNLLGYGVSLDFLTQGSPAHGIPVAVAPMAAQFILSEQQYFNSQLGWILFVLSMILYVHVKFRDFRHRETISQKSFYDELTALPNRTLFQDRLNQHLHGTRAQDSSFALMILDLDHFKEINDTLGHGSGDTLLKMVVRRLKETLRDNDFLARLGGDEFAILLAGQQSEKSVSIVANKLIKEMEEPFLLNDTPISLGVSIGITMFPEHGDSADVLLRRTDIAMYHAKEQRNCYKIYDANSDSSSVENFRLQNELRNAIREETIDVYFQPKVDCDSKSTHGVEVLARWKLPDGTFIPPNVFIPLAKQSGQIEKLTMVILRKAIEQASQWYQSGMPVSIAINITGENIQNQTFPEEVSFILQRFQFPANLLELELTEDVIIGDIAQALAITQVLTDMGVSISIDDFGTGNSSISYLKKLPIQTLKVDQSFVREIHTNENDLAIVKATIMLGKSLGLKVVAEGVEDLETWQVLECLGCDTIQGYYISKPIPGQDMTQWLATSQWGVKGSDNDTIAPLSRKNEPPPLAEAN